ncbi:MAG: hypothetical protein FD161_4232 [Limisphaerales bacterium]|nr:MAG: hypothetical protein FD161_4232 [Limisphaerales bacterium]KAG0507059.1 MAG: hypothetical protein E1N63_3765 [Limisphaerales bacterium]TXT51740.1 MAG: hypothetical protein FD140_1381 [Limisphaerales bacterium]
MNPPRLGLRWQSAAATPLFPPAERTQHCEGGTLVVRFNMKSGPDYRGQECPFYDRSAGLQSGGVLRFPPQSKTRAVLPESSSIRVPSLSFPNLWVISSGCLP